VAAPPESDLGEQYLHHLTLFICGHILTTDSKLGTASYLLQLIFTLALPRAPELRPLALRVGREVTHMVCVVPAHLWKVNYQHSNAFYDSELPDPVVGFGITC
jgi:hypothetical protein